MSRLVASDNALRALLLLSQHEGGMRTFEVAAALEISYTGAEKALDILTADGLATVSERRCERVDSPRTREAIRFALAFLPPAVAIAALARGNESVEFAGVDDQGALIVFRRFADPAGEGRIRDAVATLCDLAPDVRIEFVRKETLRDQLLSSVTPRKRAAGMRILAGTIDRTFPDRTPRAPAVTRPLGRLHDAVPAISARQLRGLAREYGLRRILAFGSATRSDFRPDSDVDLLVEPLPGRRLDIDERVSLMATAERLFGRDVDLVTAPVRRTSLAERIGHDAVVLYDAAG
jgi:predicted nucleotidyltransferase